MRGKMKTVIKDVIELSIFGGVFGFIAMLLKPFVSVKRSIKDVIASILVSVIIGLLLEYTGLPITVKYGVVGLFSSFAPQVFEGLHKIALKFSRNPEKVIDNVVDKIKK